MEHKAFIFDTQAFKEELYPIIISSGLDKNPIPLYKFINNHLGKVFSPYTGILLEADWESELENGGIQELADFSMTCFYSPDDDRGLSYSWDSVLEVLKNVSEKLDPKYCILGESLEAELFLLDPGGMGTGFVEAEDVPLIYKILVESKDKVVTNGLPSREDILYDINITELIEAYDELVLLYKDATEAKRGLLMTF